MVPVDLLVLLHAALEEARAELESSPLGEGRHGQVVIHVNPRQQSVDVHWLVKGRARRPSASDNDLHGVLD